MRFAPSREQQGFAASLGELLAASDITSVARAWAAGDPGPGRKLWQRLGEQGVLGLAVPDFGATPVDLVLAFEQLGRAALPGPLVESGAVLPALLARSPDQLSAITAGELIATVAVPPQVPYALDGDVADACYLVEDGRLSLAAAVSEHRSIDPTRRLATVRPTEALGQVDVGHALVLGALACAAQLLGAGQTLLDRAVAYAKERTQFGKPIGSFQAVKHQLADVHVALDMARPLLFGAALAIGTPSQGRDVSAAKIACSAAANRAARSALQVHGAIGYTAEYDLSLWLLKVRALVSAWGTRRQHRDRVLAALR